MFEEIADLNNTEYVLNESLIREMIGLYGVLTKFILVKRINRDDTVFGDFSHLKTDSEKIYNIHMLPEVSEDWDTTDYGFTQFGLTNFDNISLFVAKSAFNQIPDIVNESEKIVGNLIMFPNNKLMEITNVDLTVPGINNLFTYNDAKSVYKLSCKPYDIKLINELDNIDISAEAEVEYETLDTYFQELIDISDAQDTEAEVTEQVTTITKTTDVDTKVQKPIVDKTEDDIFGAF